MKILFLSLLVALCLSYASSEFDANVTVVANVDLTLPSVGITARRLFDTAVSIVADVKAVVSGLANVFLSDLGKVSINTLINTSLPAILSQLEGAVLALRPLVEVAKSIASSIVCNLEALILEVETLRVQILINVVNATQQLYANAIASGSTLVIKSLEYLTQGLQVALHQAIGTALDLVVSVKSLGRDAIDKAIAAVVSLTTVLKNVLESIIEALVNTVVNGVSLSVDQTETLVSHLIGAIRDQLTVIGQDLSAIVNATQSVKNEVLADLTSRLNGLKLKIQCVIDFLNHLKASASGEAAATLSTLINALQNLQIKVDFNLDLVVNGGITVTH